MQCNIDARGKAIRLICGMALVIAAVLLTAFWAWPSGGWVAWSVSLLALAGGAFAIFEARAGWCVIRAMGFRTPF